MRPTTIAILLALAAPAAAQHVSTIEEFLASHPIGEEPIRHDELSRAPGASLHVVQVARGAKLPLHYHHEHDENVYLYRGAGVQVLGDERREVKAGDVVQIPRRVPHAFENSDAGVAVAVVFYSPAFDGQDRHGLGPGERPRSEFHHLVRKQAPDGSAVYSTFPDLFEVPEAWTAFEIEAELALPGGSLVVRLGFVREPWGWDVASGSRSGVDAPGDALAPGEGGDLRSLAVAASGGRLEPADLPGIERIWRSATRLVLRGVESRSGPSPAIRFVRGAGGWTVDSLSVER